MNTVPIQRLSHPRETLSTNNRTIQLYQHRTRSRGPSVQTSRHCCLEKANARSRDCNVKSSATSNSQQQHRLMTELGDGLSRLRIRASHARPNRRTTRLSGQPCQSCSALAGCRLSCAAVHTPPAVGTVQPATSKAREEVAVAVPIRSGRWVGLLGRVDIWPSLGSRARILVCS